MKGADTKNRNAIKALDSVVQDVKLLAERGTSTQQTALTRGLNALESKMEAYLETKTRKADRAEIESKIKAVGIRIETIDTRIDKVEQATADALSAVGAKISEFASVVEDRAKTM